MIQRIRNYSALSMILLFSLPIFASANQDPEALETTSSQDAIWVWAERNENQHAILLSRSVDGTWEEPEKISDNDAINVVPAVTKMDGKSLLVVWSAFKNGQAQLLFKFQEDGGWSEEIVYYTGLSSNTAPSVAVDGDGKAWLVWAGFNGLNDEIYYSTWDGSGFDTPTAITSNGVPDILPVLGFDASTGSPWIQWRQFTPTGYVDYQSHWEEGEWSKPAAVPIGENPDYAPRENTAEQRHALVKKTVAPAGVEETPAENSSRIAEVEIEIPEFVTEPDSASIHQPGQEIQSLPVRSMILVK